MGEANVEKAGELGSEPRLLPLSQRAIQSLPMRERSLLDLLWASGSAPTLTLDQLFENFNKVEKTRKQGTPFEDLISIRRSIEHINRSLELLGEKRPLHLRLDETNPDDLQLLVSFTVPESKPTAA